MQDNPIPLWWNMVWTGTIVLAVCYALFYHLSPMVLTPVERWSAQRSAALGRKYATIADIPLSDEKMLMLMNDPHWRETGASLYRRCVQCHGENGEGYIGPNLTDDAYKDIRSLTDFVSVVTNGAGGGTMPAQKGVLSKSEIAVVSAFVASLRGKNLKSPRPAEGEVIPPWPAPDEPRP